VRLQRQLDLLVSLPNAPARVIGASVVVREKEQVGSND
jgi:hypothetical protein